MNDHMDESRRVEIKYEIDGKIESAVVTLEPGETIEPGDELIAVMGEVAGQIVLKRRERVSPFDGPEYQRFYEEAGHRCRCDSPVPCGGVLGGGMCDEVQNDGATTDG